MRLQEPINGIKIAVGHVIIHLSFLITTFEINTDVSINLNADKSLKGSKYDSPYDPVDSHRLLASSSDSEPIDPMEVKQHELQLFRML